MRGDFMDIIKLDRLTRKISYLYDEREASNLYMLNNKRILKIFDSDFLAVMSNAGFDIERKVLNYETFIDGGIITPCEAVYLDKRFVGYTMPYFNGVSIFDAYESGYFNNSLYKFAEFFYKLEKIVINNDKIVFPDLLSDGNIMVNAHDNIGIIDFDDLQVGDYPTPTISSGLGNRNIYLNSKKYMDGLLYSKELDVKSLIYLYFNLVFHIDLSIVDDGIDYFHKRIILEEIFADSCIDDNDLIDKVLRLYDDDDNNLYMGDTLFRLAEKYFLDDVYYDDFNIKKLVKK